MLTRAASVYYNRTYIGGPEIFFCGTPHATGGSTCIRLKRETVR